MWKGTLIALCLVSSPLFADQLEEARSLVDGRQYGEARKLLEETVTDPAREAQSLVLLTEICNALETYEEGIGYGERAVELRPESSEAYFQYAVALRLRLTKGSKLKAMFRVGGYKDALNKAMELDPKNVDAREEEIGFLMQAPGIAGGDKEKAKQRIEDLKQIDPRRGRRLESNILADEDKVEESIEILQALVEEDAEDVWSRQILAYRLQGAKRYREADAHFSRLLEESDPEISFGARYQLARSKVLGEYEQERAIELLREYIETVPDLASLPGKSPAYWRLGMAQQQLDRMADAREAFEQALALDGSNKEAKKALRALPKS